MMRTSRLRSIAGIIVSLGLGACGPTTPLHLAVLMPAASSNGARPAMAWAAASVNAAGGIDGRTLIVDEIGDTAMSDEERLANAERLAADDRYVAVIGPGGSDALALIADTFVQRNKPLVSFTSTGAEQFRAWGGKGAIWRTRESDIAQVELLVRFARDRGAKKIGLVTGLGENGYTFFSWFGFFARELGYAEADAQLTTLDANTRCPEAMQKALAAAPDILFFAPTRPEEIECAVRGNLPAMPGQPPRTHLILADTGFAVPDTLMKLGVLSEGVEGISPVPAPTDFEARLQAAIPGAPGPHAASEYDAVLLLAYGLQAAHGKGGTDLINAMKAVVTGKGAAAGWDEAGIRAALSALRDGEHPDVSGATGPLDFDPKLYMDLASSTFSHWGWRMGARQFEERWFTGDAAFLSSKGVLVQAGTGGGPVPDPGGANSTWTPPAARTDLWAVIAALSTGFSNYRHQADALRQYRILRNAGVPDDHIILVIADDIATDPANPKSGEVRNEVGGKDLRAGAEIDYRLSLTADELMDVIAGRVAARTPKVVNTTRSSNLYVYLVGHGGVNGIPLSAATTSDGLAGAGTSQLTPKLLRETLCGLTTGNKLRRALVVVESCYGGVFGDAGYNGVEGGCSGGAIDPPDGVVLVTAANTKEVSFADGYDPAVKSWVADAFSQRLAGLVEANPAMTLTDAYRNLYLGVTGSHASFYNAAAAGRLSDVRLDEFFRP